MKKIAAAKFKEQCLSLLDQVDPDGIVITKHGKPVAKLIPFSSDSSRPHRLPRGQGDDQEPDPLDRSSMGC